MAENLIELKRVSKYYPIKNAFGFGKGEVKAVDGVSFNIQKGETFGLVGESGSGKSTLGRTIIQMHQATAGEVVYKGIDLTKLSKEKLSAYHKDMQIIFQDPYSSLNPRLSALEIVMEPLIVLNQLSKEKAKVKAIEMLEKVGLKDQEVNKYPSEFSGGQRQRIGIARAIAVDPEFILCDEPVSALDVSIQAQVINLLIELQESMGLTYLFVSHDLSIVQHIADRVAVMYLGKIVEIGKVEDVFANPLHPYTKTLLAAVPIADPKLSKEIYSKVLTTEVESPYEIALKTLDHSHCHHEEGFCQAVDPDLVEFKKGHTATCYLPE